MYMWLQTFWDDTIMKYKIYVQNLFPNTDMYMYSWYVQNLFLNTDMYMYSWYVIFFISEYWYVHVFTLAYKSIETILI
jgi:hypothetical protein